ncbi:unnamed protein product [Nezara viridula]|uniref:Smr domain-containing protein n=1 Tax=Nezara viridula TaxID=85310 RepID=A0A9P0HIV7_NEZVI|nr:unnamed protein product [Nezara viridula]
MASQQHSLPPDVQENIVHNIQKIFPNYVDKKIIRAVLNRECWDLEKSLAFLKSSVNSFNENPNNPRKTENRLKKLNQPKQHPKKNKMDNSNISTSGPNKPPELLKNFKKKTRSKPNAKPQNCEKPKGDSLVQGDWVLVSEHGSQASKVQDTSKDKSKSFPPENKPQINDKRSAKRKQMMQHYELIKQFGEPLNRISAYINEGIKVMILLRGCSGSGKTTYANQLLKKHGAKYHQSHVFSADNYFVNKEGKYIFNYDLLQNAHTWNQKLVRLAVTEGRSPIFVDNTNTRLWEMKDYAIMAVEFGYILETLEPPTPWFFNEDQLFRKTLHNVPRETIKKMLDRYEANVSGEDVLRALKLNYGSVAPPQFVIAGLDQPISKKHSKIYNERLESSNNVQNKSVSKSKSTKPSDSPQFRPSKSTENLDNSHRLSSFNFKPFGNMPVQENNPARFGRPGPFVPNSNPAPSHFFGPGNSTIQNHQVHYPPQFYGPNNGPYMTAAVPNVFNSQFVNRNFIPNAPPSEFYQPTNRSSEPRLDNASGNKMVAENIMDTTPPYVDDLIDLTVPLNVETISDLKERPSFSREMSSSISLLEGLKIEGEEVLYQSDSESDDEGIEDEEEDDEESCVEDTSGSVSDGGEESSTSYTTALTTVEPASSEYVIVKDEEILFQKTHEEVTGIKTLEDFRAKTSSTSFSQNFENFLFQYMEDSRNGAKVSDVLQNNTKQEESNLCTEFNQTCKDGKIDKVVDDSSDDAVMSKRVRPTTSLGDWIRKDVNLEKPINFLPKDQRVKLPEEMKKISLMSVSTNTNYLDFETLREVNNGINVENVKVLQGSPFFLRAISNIPFLPATVLMLDKGVMTTNIETSQVLVRDSGIERLALMFPGVARENLEELFDKCQKDIDWTVGLLLDSGQEMSELYSSLEPIECETYDNITYSIENSDVKESDVLFGEIKKQKKRKNDQESNKYKEIQEKIQNNFNLGEIHYSERMKKHIERKHNIHIGAPAGTSNADVPENVVGLEDGIDSQTENSDSEEDGVFMMDSDFIFQLQSRFGGLLRPNMIGEKTVVSIPSSLARQLHSYIMDSILQQIEGEDLFTDSLLEKDEELARSLQEEELKTRGARSLLEIMDEEVALKTTSHKDVNSGKSMASTLSKQLLIERFPRMDPATLALILEDTNHSLHEATCLLSSAGHFQADPNQEPEQREPDAPEPTRNTLSREEAIKQADAYGDVASKLYELRKDCIKKSQDAYREGNSSVALYYSEMARWYMERIEKCNSLAAKAILNGYEGFTTLDLHFLQVSEALNVLDLFVDEVIRGLHESKDKKAIVYIITGRGLHSAGGRPRLKPAVQSRLLKRDLRYVEQNPGMLRVIIPRTAMTSYNREVAVCA